MIGVAPLGVLRRAAITACLLACAASIASAQSLGTFRWQLQPFCNVLTLAVTQAGSVFRLEGTDDQCGSTKASAIGMAFFNPNGSIGIGLTIVAAPAGAPVHVDASISAASLGGTWRDSGNHVGTFVFTPGAAVAGSPRPLAGMVGGIAVGPGLSGGGTAGNVLVELATTPTGAFDLSNPIGLVATGGDGPTTPPVSGPGFRFMWYPARAALRAGMVTGTEWDEPNVGSGSLATGFNTVASGFESVAGGFFARASGDMSVALGDNVEAAGRDAVALGGFSKANGTGSVALGLQVASTTDGTFMFGDRSTATKMITVVPNQFLVRASGGTAFYSNSTLTTGVTLAAGGGQWLQMSDANMKEQFRDLDGDEVLAKIARMPIREWSYTSQDTAIRHVGPTAQDFHTAFALGEDPLRIGTIDADGIALRAIQALEARTRMENVHLIAENENLRRDNAALEVRTRDLAERLGEIDALKAQIAAVQAALAALQGARR